jgi:hypothetical protein
MNEEETKEKTTVTNNPVGALMVLCALSVLADDDGRKSRCGETPRGGCGSTKGQRSRSLLQANRIAMATATRCPVD